MWFAGDATGSQTPCPAVHVKGDDHVISCYSVDENILALVSKLPVVSVQIYDTASAEGIIAPQLDRLKQVLANTERGPQS